MSACNDVEDEITFRTYVLQVIGPERYAGHDQEIPKPLIRETEENLTDLLPEGYRVTIKEWDA